MKNTIPTNRFERLLNKHRKYVRFINYFLKIIGIVIILLFLLEFFSFLIITTYEFYGYNIVNKGVPDNRIRIDVYKDAEWASQYFIEDKESNKAEYYPYLEHRRISDYKGQYINLDENSIRKTFFQCPDNNSKSIKIFVFGGSTIWGTGARDIGTIPSFLSKYLCENGFKAEVTNFGESGYTSTHDMFKLQLELKKGNTPDIAIFYEGANDIYSSYQNHVAGLPHNLKNRIDDFNSRNRVNIQNLFPNLRRIINKIFGENMSFREYSDEDLNMETANVYLDNIRIIKSLEENYKFKSFFYWQPTIYTKKELSYDEKNKIDHNAVLNNDYKSVSGLIKTSDEIKDLTEIFDDKETTIFIDWVHISEEGNSIIAEEMSEDIINYLKGK